MNTPVNFELAKLLKEKGFDVPKNKMYCRSIPMFEKYHVVKFYDGDKHECSKIPHDWNNTESPVGSTEYYSAPTIAEVVMWLYEKHDVWISLIPDISSGHQLLMRKMSVHLFRYRNGLNVQTETLRDNSRDIIYFLSPTESYKAAIEYTLTNLI